MTSVYDGVGYVIRKPAAMPQRALSDAQSKRAW